MSKQKVFVTRSDFPKCAFTLLSEKFDVECYPFPEKITDKYLLDHIKGASALYCQSTDDINEKVLDAAGQQLKIVATMSLGFEHIDISACKKRNIIVTNDANPVYVSIVAEYTVGLLLTVARRFIEADAAVRRGEWTKVWDPTWLVGRGLVNSTIGIVGMGRIGLAVLERIMAFKINKALYYDVYKPIEKAEALGAHYASFEELLKESDFVIVNCNLTEENKGLLGSKAFSLMKSNAVFINTSRGGIVDQEALFEALRNRQIRAAGIDVMYPEPLPPDHALLSLPNLVVTPHIAASEELALMRNSTITAENIIEVLEGRPPLTPVF
ncbi:glyoxylate reductase/hydroxypyruvate reductase isoform X1 [Parasteatoda tepidariorum]|uniref:glyoxylate reductase/hydroxypyruvate reductase isoform X1 n=1 Tax=Parasteatoda tepidariorum TaxID=114398 RepID=UPI001C71D429|nr:glyoxylate reductase/hydroxypyruvate reductase isoform X1 [Parasteatoda tepidariorum]